MSDGFLDKIRKLFSDLWNSVIHFFAKSFNIFFTAPVNLNKYLGQYLVNSVNFNTNIKTIEVGSVLGAIGAIIGGIITFHIPADSSAWVKIVNWITGGWIRNIVWDYILDPILNYLFGFKIEDVYSYAFGLAVKILVYWFAVPFGFNLLFETLLAGNSFFPIRIFTFFVGYLTAYWPLIDIFAESAQARFKKAVDSQNMQTARNCITKYSEGNELVFSYLVDFIINLFTFDSYKIQVSWIVFIEQFYCFDPLFLGEVDRLCGQRAIRFYSGQDKDEYNLYWCAQKRLPALKKIACKNNPDSVLCKDIKKALDEYGGKK